MDEKPVTIFSGTTGQNNMVDPVRLKLDIETGIAELAETGNVIIDDTGRISSRLGKTPISTVPSQVWCDKAAAFQVQQRTSDAAIFQLNPDASVPVDPVVSGLVKGERIGFWQAGVKTYWSSLSAHGVIREGINGVWPGYAHVGAPTQRVFSAAPFGNKICVFKGRMWIAVDNWILVSEYRAFGKFNLAKMFFPFNSNVLMMKPVKHGVWVSDSEQTGVIAYNGKFEAMEWNKRSSFPAHEFSENIELTDYSNVPDYPPGLCATWSSNEGLHVGTPDGQMLPCPTKDKLYYPAGGSGSTVVDGHNVINSVW